MINATPTLLDRIMDSVRAIIRAELPQLTYSALWQYQVSASTVIGGVAYVDASSLTPGTVPDVTQVPVLPAIGGTLTVPAAGARVLVGFVNADPTRPVVLAMDPLAPVSVQLGGGATDKPALGAELGRVVRYGDQVTIPVAGAVAVGLLTQSPVTAPNAVSRVRA